MSRKSFHIVGGVPVPVSQEGVIIRNSVFSSQGPVISGQLPINAGLIEQKNTILPVGATLLSSSVIPQTTIVERRVIENSSGPVLHQSGVADNFRYEYKTSSSSQIDVNLENQKLRQEIEVLREKLRLSEGLGSKENDIVLIEKRNLEIELNKLRDILTLRDRELSEWKGRYTKLELSVQEGQGSDSGKFKDLEGRIHLLISENQKLNLLLKEKMDELELVRARMGNLEGHVSTSRSFESDVKKYREMIDLRDREIEEWKAKYVNVEVLYNDSKQAEYKLRDWERRNLLLQQDNERLQNILKEKIEELERWKKRSNEIDIISIESRHYEKKAVESEERMNLLIKEIDEWKIRYKRLESDAALGKSDSSKIRDLENKLALLTQEIERLNNINILRNGDIEEWKKKCSILEKERDVEVDRKVAYFKEEIYKLNNSISSKNIEFEALQKSLSSRVSEADYQRMKEELTGLKLALMTKNNEINDLNLKITSTKLLPAERKQYEEKIVDLELRISDLHEEIVKLKDKRSGPVTRLSMSGHSNRTSGGGLFESEKKEVIITNNEKIVRAEAPEIISSRITQSIISEDISGNLKSQPAFKTITISKNDAEGTSQEFLRSVLFDPIERLPKANLTDSGKLISTSFQKTMYESYSPQKEEQAMKLSSGGSSGLKNLGNSAYSAQRDDILRVSADSGKKEYNYTYGKTESKGSGSNYGSPFKKEEYLSEKKEYYQSGLPQSYSSSVVTQTNYATTSPNRFADANYLSVPEKKKKLDKSFTSSSSSSSDESAASDLPEKGKKKNKK